MRCTKVGVKIRHLNYVRYVLILLFLVSLFGCKQRNQKEMPTETATAVLTETPTKTPTSTPSPTLTPVYSYFPPISASNATQAVNITKYIVEVDSLAFSPNGKYLVATINNGAGIFWDISTAKGWNEWIDAPRDVFVSNGQVSFSPDSSILATGGTLLEFPSKKVVQELPGTVVFSPINQTLASFEWDNFSLWNLDGKQWVLNHKQDSKGVANIAFSPDGSLLGEALHWGGGEGVNVWRVSDHTLLHSFLPPEHNHPAHFNFDAYAFLAFSPDNQFIATGTKDHHIIHVWNLQTGELVKDLNTVIETQDGEYYIPDVGCVAFSQDAKVIILVGGNRIIFRTFPNGDLIRELEIEIFYMSPTDYITTCTTSRDGRLFATGDSGGNVNIWGVPAYAP